jgi:hypothetical protein
MHADAAENMIVPPSLLTKQNESEENMVIQRQANAFYVGSVQLRNTIS